MPLKATTPLFHRYTRPLMAGLATVGAIVTAYLTVSKLTGSTTACPIKGCDIVLSSPYATVMGQPLALFGFLAYIGMVIFAIAPLLVRDVKKKEISANLNRWTQPLLFIGGTAMMVFSGYLMYLLTAEIKSLCLYCVGSALLSTSLFLLAWLGQTWTSRSQPIFIGTITALLVIVGTLGIYANVNPPVDPNSTETLGPAITTSSGPAEISLAQHLEKTKATFYGAWWCPHCHGQKQLFGAEAFQLIPYVECSTPDGTAQTPVCQEDGITGYPTWAINGKRLPGSKTLKELAQLTKYEGPSDFSNTP